MRNSLTAAFLLALSLVSGTASAQWLSVGPSPYDYLQGVSAYAGESLGDNASWCDWDYDGCYVSAQVAWMDISGSDGFDDYSEDEYSVVVGGTDSYPAFNMHSVGYYASGGWWLDVGYCDWWDDGTCWDDGGWGDDFYEDAGVDPLWQGCDDYTATQMIAEYEMSGLWANYGYLPQCSELLTGTGGYNSGNYIYAIIRNGYLFERLPFIGGQVGYAISLTSAYRNPSHNTEVGGEYDSRHQWGDAIDFKGATDPSGPMDYGEWSYMADIAQYNAAASYVEPYDAAHWTHVHADWRYW